MTLLLEEGGAVLFPTLVTGYDLKYSYRLDHTKNPTEVQMVVNIHFLTLFVGFERTGSIIIGEEREIEILQQGNSPYL